MQSTLQSKRQHKILKTLSHLTSRLLRLHTNHRLLNRRHHLSPIRRTLRPTRRLHLHSPRFHLTKSAIINRKRTRPIRFLSRFKNGTILRFLSQNNISLLRALTNHFIRKHALRLVRRLFSRTTSTRRLNKLLSRTNRILTVIIIQRRSGIQITIKLFDRPEAPVYKNTSNPT